MSATEPLRHLRASTANKRPTPAAMADGQLALNTNNTSPGLFFKDSNGALVKVGPVHVGATAPNASPAAGGSTGNAIGEQWLDTAGGTYVFKVWDGTAWRSETGTFVDVNGDVMTGALGIIAGSASAPGLYFSGDTNTGIYSPGADQVAISSSGVGRLFVDANGHIGLASAASAWGDSANGSRAIQIGGSSWYNYRTSIVNFGHGYYYDASDNYRYVYTGVPVSYCQQTSGEHRWFNAASGTAGNTFTPLERMRLDSQGRLGLGTSSPGALLDLAGGAIRLNSTHGIYKANADGYLYFSGGTGLTAGGTIFCFGESHAGNANEIHFRNTTNQTRAVIDASGRFLIGQTSSGDSTALVLAGYNGGANNTPAVLWMKRTTASSSITAGDALGLIRFGSSDSGFGASIDAIADGTWSSTSDCPGRLLFNTSPDGSGAPLERMRIDSSGRVGVGTTSPLTKFVASNGGAEGIELAPAYSSGNNFTFHINRSGSAYVTNSQVASAHIFRISSDSTEAARIDSSGRLLVGTSSTSSSAIAIVQGTSSISSVGRLYIAHRNTSPGYNDALGTLAFTDSGHVQAAEITAAQDGGTWSSTSKPTKLVFSTTADGASSPTERMRITNSGNVLINKTVTSASVAGIGLEAVGTVTAVRSSDICYLANRLTTDGSLFDFYQDTNIEGSISVSGSTVSYNGAHLSRWSQLPGIDPHDKDQRPEILRGTVMSNLDEMCDWINPESGEAQDNEQLNKTKISDVEGDKNVAGIFQSWDDDDDTWVNDYYLAMTGDFVIRIAAGVTVERGDLLMSAGDGTAKPQDDDTIRSKTIAKVTSTNVSCTYEDGSYCVPCVLMAC